MTQIYQPRHGTRHGPRHGTDNFGDFEEINFAQPEAQTFPSSLAEVAALGWSTNVMAGWAMQEAAAPLLDFSGNGYSMDLEPGGTGKALIGQRAVGLFDGSSFRSQKCFETFGAGNVLDRYVVASPATLDFDWTTPWSCLLVFRVPSIALTNPLLGKFNGTNGWFMACATDGTVHAAVYSLAGGGGALAISSIANFADGGWHWALAKFDPVSDTMTIVTDLDPVERVQFMSSITTPTTSGRFGFGGLPAAYGAAHNQIRGCIVWSDLNTTQAAVEAWWRHGRVPTGLTYTRGSAFHAPVADDATTGDVLATSTLNRFALEYNALISTNPLKLGMASDTVTTNLVPNSDLNITTVWAESAGTRTVYAADSPRGLREAILHTKANATDRVVDAGTGAAVTAAGVYNASVWCRWNGVGTAPELRVYRADVTTLIGTASATLSDNRWHRLNLTFTAPATEVARLSISGAAAASSTGSAWFFGPQITTENYAKPYVHTSGSPASTSTVIARVTVPGLHSDSGTIKTWNVFRGPIGAPARFTAQATSSLDTLVRARVVGFYGSGVGVHAMAAYNELGVFVDDTSGAAVLNPAVENISRGWWDKSEAAGWALRQQLNSLTVSTDNIDLPVGGPCENVYIGSYWAGNQICGVVSKIRVWRRVALEA